MQVTYGAWNNIGRIIHSVNDDDDNELDRGLEEGQKNLVSIVLSNNIFTDNIRLIVGVGGEHADHLVDPTS